MQDQKIIELIRSGRNDQALLALYKNFPAVKKLIRLNGGNTADAVYLLPDKLNSFIRLTPANGQYTEKLNELIKYKLICVGYKGERAFYYSVPAVEPKAYTNIELAEIATSELSRILNQEKNRNPGSRLQKELAYYQFYKKDKIRQQDNANRKQLKT